MDTEQTPDPTAERMRALEERVAALEARVASPPAGEDSRIAPSPATGGSAAHRASEDAATERAGSAPTGSTPVNGEVFWALNGLIERAGPAGGVVYTGHLTPPGAEASVSWQMGLPTAALEEISFAEAAGSLAALGSRVRLELLQAVYEGTSTAAELSADDRFGTTGQIYHHLNALAGAGWLENSKRGHWRIPAQRIVPLLTLILIGAR
ncbi:hypothetical protein DFO66_102192 [Brevibacterium sanguinis]|uniref:ArsR family transcriptional regulator n=2 Tax=Brevibacterium TaxID=1696 RepID=A0A366INU0_9MICO|nr:MULTISPECIES: winged helix-turn-helix domain-containing protein [Brevibacterium]RBP67139.1 hypothetical protein DFO66_102192 [Brevibacterium sanguinis]RBP73664.1 hypothetical protein DFO65_102192 [Brevibacterium celere]